MPEGPEIRRAADRLRKALEGRQVIEVRFASDRFPQLRRDGVRLSGRRVIAVQPRGKAMLTHFERGLTIYSHNQLYGEWVVHRGPAPPTHLQTRLSLRTATHTVVLYSASEIEVLKTADVGRHPYIARLGVELLDPATRIGDVLRQIDDPRFGRRGLGALLLDQGFLAGPGNYLRSDILFAARLRPEVKPADLTPAQKRALGRAAIDLTRRSYRTGGITNDPAHARSLKARGMCFAAYRHWVFEREGEPCRLCGHTIRRIDAGGRGLFLCEHCQPALNPSSNLSRISP